LSTDSGYQNLSEALGLPGCAVCRLKTEAADGFVESLLYEGVTDPDRRHTLRQSQGYCHEHMWSLERTGASLGTAIIAQDLLQRAVIAVDDADFESGAAWSLQDLRDLLARRPRDGANARLAERLGPQTSCPACIWSEKMELLYLEDVLKYLPGESGLMAEFEASDGLCMRHFRRALRLVRDRTVFEAITRAQVTIWERLIDDLGEFVRKNDHRFRNEPMSARQGDAWLRAISTLVGALPGREK
jgi:hypothetical protein